MLSLARISSQRLSLQLRMPIQSAGMVVSSPVKVDQCPASALLSRWMSSDAPQKKSGYDGSYLLPHPQWTKEELHNVSPKWPGPENMRQRIARLAISVIRFNFDVLTGFKFNPTESRWLTRMVFLETIAGVPGFCGAAIRHLRSLRAMERDRGWIHSLIGEAENERMHLLTLLEIRKPGTFMRLMVGLSQAVFWNFYFLCFLLSPKFSFALVSSLEIEAVKTYSHCLEEIESGSLQHWKTIPAPEISIKYWNMKPDATLVDLIYNIRADEAHHRHVNHVFSNLEPYKDANPFSL